MNIRMSLLVLGIFALSVLLPSVFGMPCYLFMVDVTVPQKEGRNEMEDIRSIKTILDDFTKSDDVKAHFAMKALDNQLIRLFIDIDHVEGMCHWPSLTSAFTKKGYKTTVTPMEDCSYYAARLGLNITYPPVSDFKQKSLFLTAVRQFDDTVKSPEICDAAQHHAILHPANIAVHGEKYIDQVKEQFKYDMKTKSVLQRRCYAALMDVPVRLMYIAAGPIERALQINDETNLKGKTTVDYQMFQSLEVYKETY